jgi:hypothetical protein
MAKAKRKAAPSRAASTRRVSSGTHPKATLITWIVIIALVAGLVGGYFIAKAKY